MDKFKNLGEQISKSIDKDKLDQVEARLKDEADKRGLGEAFDKAKAMVDQATGQPANAPAAVESTGGQPAEGPSAAAAPAESSAQE